MHKSLIGSVAVSLFMAMMVQSAFARDTNDIVRDVVADYIRPAVTELNARAKTMHAAAEILCEGPDEAALETARDEFDALAKDWGRVELLRLGPLVQENRLERMLFWPDRRGRGLKQVRDIVRTGDPSALNVETLADKSVAVQGLLALEFALYGTGSEELATGEGSTQCAYVEAITANITDMTREIETAWYDDGPQAIATLWQNPSDSNPLFRDGREQLSALFKVVGEGLEIVSVQRIEPLLGNEFAGAKPKSALFWRSDNTINIIDANIAGLEDIMRAADLEAAAEGDARRTADSLFFEFGNARRTLDEINMSTEAIAQDEVVYNKLVYVNIVARSIEMIMRGQLSPAFNLSSGFSSLDGD